MADRLRGLLPDLNTFIDSDDLYDLRSLLEDVKQSGVLVLLQSSGVLTRPWCLLESEYAPLRAPGDNNHHFVYVTTRHLAHLTHHHHLQSPRRSRTTCQSSASTCWAPTATTTPRRPPS